MGTWRRNDPARGYYRYSAGEVFGQIKKSGRKWLGEVRHTSGSLKQYAGIWGTLKDAKEEIEFLTRDDLEFARTL